MLCAWSSQYPHRADSARSVAQRLRFRRSRRGQRASSRNLSL